MSEEAKIFTKTQLVEKLQEVAKKQKEKNDIIIAEKDKSISDLTKQNEDLIKNISEKEQTIKSLKEENETLKNEVENKSIELSKLEKMNKAVDTNFNEFYDKVSNLVKEYLPNSEGFTNTLETSNTIVNDTSKKKRSKKAEEVKEEKPIEKLEEKPEQKDIKEELSEEKEIDIDALLKSL